jgi:hypothetical protein
MSEELGLSAAITASGTKANVAATTRPADTFPSVVFISIAPERMSPLAEYRDAA